MKTHYEWTIETIEDGDIIDVDFSDTLDFSPDTDQRIGLRMYKGNETHGFTGGWYAYPVDGEMPTQFDDGEKIPARYLAEYKKWASK
jgi:hypothetical protein